MLYKRRGIKNFQWISIWQSSRDNLRKVIEKFNQYTIHELIETFERPQFDSWEIKRRMKPFKPGDKSKLKPQ